MKFLLDKKKHLEGILNSEITLTIDGEIGQRQVYLNELEGKLKEKIIKSAHIEIKRVNEELRELGVEM